VIVLNSPYDTKDIERYQATDVRSGLTCMRGLGGLSLEA
jgi:hypothetical protein